MLLRTLRVEPIWLMHTGSPDHRIWLRWPSSCSSSSSLKPGRVQTACYLLRFAFYSCSIHLTLPILSQDFVIRLNAVELWDIDMKHPDLYHLDLFLPTVWSPTVTQTTVSAVLMFWSWGMWCSVNHVNGFAPRESSPNLRESKLWKETRTSVTGIIPVHSLFVPLGSACLLWAHRACNCIY